MITVLELALELLEASIDRAVSELVPKLKLIETLKLLLVQLPEPAILPLSLTSTVVALWQEPETVNDELVTV